MDLVGCRYAEDFFAVSSSNHSAKLCVLWKYSSGLCDEILFFFLIIKVFSHAYLDLSQLFESGQQFSLWNKNMVGINPIRVQ